ncbi:unnamed protein product [Soboliphyme baturini]|uniref:Uncharacterized protein n=1 Tax=Soboliphyme baturini TaxID=241478 RepID=A0A183INX4_9BILA|nr:unnamed protein product [Soboliphyme baturini]
MKANRSRCETWRQCPTAGRAAIIDGRSSVTDLQSESTTNFLLDRSRQQAGRTTPWQRERCELNLVNWKLVEVSDRLQLTIDHCHEEGHDDF